MNKFKEFTGLYPVQKTLRFELIPQGRTMEHLTNSGFLEDDRNKAEKYAILKKVIDDYHKRFIEECLSKASLDWGPLAECLAKARQSKEEKDKKALEAEQKRMRGEIVKLFTKDERFGNLFAEKLFSELLPSFVRERGISAEGDALKSFDKFSGYFIGFHENRRNIYSAEDDTTAISNRIVNENFPIFIDNNDNYLKIRKEIPEVIRDAEAELAGYGIKMDDIFSPDNFNNVLTQDGIGRYNLALGGAAPSSHEKLRGLNEFVNLDRQQNQNIKKKIRLTPLRKQILSDRNSYSYIPQAFEKDEEVLSSIKGFFEDVENENIFERALKLISSLSEYDTSKIHVRQADLSKISLEIFGGWERLGSLLRIFKAEAIGDSNLEKTSKKVDKWLNSKEFALSDIMSSMSASGSEKTFNEYSFKLHLLKLEIEKAKKAVWDKEKISDNEDAVEAIKVLLDNVLRFMHMLRPFDTSRELSRDTAFYTEFDMIHDKLFAIVPLYNRTRNYLTAEKFNKNKIKLNFKNPTLADGWDVNKQYDNTAVILRRNGKYYLGIMEPERRRSIKFVEGKDATSCYQKMEYKLLPGPNKMLPKVFFSKKNIGFFDPSDEIIEGYKAGRHKKGDDFDIGFCHKLIDFFKESIQKHEDWKAFDFKFSPTESYADLSGFYREVETQGYKMLFKNIPADVIDGYVERGDLFLFQIYNKDFAERIKEGSKKNIHTMYWNAAFSEENLRDVVIKLNGEAELFYRDRSDIKKSVHREGEIMVNRKCDDERPLPDKVHKNLSRYFNGAIGKDALSDEEKGYVGRVKTFKAHYDITKDRRYLEDKMYFHVPLTLNFKADGKENINRMVTEKILRDEGTHIIGIDRGERNLIYASVIDRSGKIVLQKSFNVLDKFDYREKLDQREKERKDARVNWDHIGKIKDLKEGYLSKAVHEISKMVIEYNAVVILEDLNYGFKRGRFKVEKQIYQKFEKMLIDKLNHLVFKDVPVTEAGGVLNAYQLTAPLESFSKLGKQSGILFYVNPAYTSKIDPTTGFVDIFNTADITNAQGRKDFLRQFESISVQDNMFAFTFDYRKFKTSKTDHRNIWTVYTNGERIKYERKENRYYTVNPTKNIAQALTSFGIGYAHGENILNKIVQSDNKLTDAVYFSFLDALRMRNSDGENDYIISPVKNSKGEFFRTDPAREDIPKDSDANGAYHIALKGELLLRMIAKNYNPEKKSEMPKMEHSAWFEYMQTRGDK